MTEKVSIPIQASLASSPLVGLVILVLLEMTTNLPSMSVGMKYAVYSGPMTLSVIYIPIFRRIDKKAFGVILVILIGGFTPAFIFSGFLFNIFALLIFPCIVITSIIGIVYYSKAWNKNNVERYGAMG